ncbi:Enoyl-(Acyl carrier protein) reductase [Streptoalloteichus tenebrarius]|uniref:Enoyl-(Acyl carrier protein) reductase n=1 Tax=Streptoalloteichus tenebrarius (strain ATCC 17920 / DSM 40477 / JCM 4838 / CBS 697.72 / NBRC 16177 / NCIMB 11028 / NRRL B-12390 / A12253. 1 / ISP 5477) TaxID=1933 RepID=A0ABT1I053_STRSD|nr:short chain dehydrogenase [Streptoalloteichus tenebrarius]MCP2261172.1 Enoyl-(Acyl carrier protein) reductase [Streptoalloteichus tenebrarius]BFF02970.1 short chain dehydrogenase [Streptoalloteichus tenebrarius]
MRILLVGASGTLGGAVRSALLDRHEVVTASRSGADHRVDITDPDSIDALYRAVGRVDAVACTAGSVPFRPLTELTREDFLNGVVDKLLGQVELVRRGVEAVSPGGSFTLVTGVLSHDPIRTGSVASLVNGALDSFVRAAAIELPDGRRINAVSPTVLSESAEKYADFFPGFPPVPAAQAAMAYVKSIEGAQTGQVYRVG